MDPLTLLTVAGTFAWNIFEKAAGTAGGGVLEGQSDKVFCDAVRQIKRPGYGVHEQGQRT